MVPLYKHKRTYLMCNIRERESERERKRLHVLS